MQAAKDAEFHEKIVEGRKKLQATFDAEEIITLGYYPHIAEHAAWRYGLKVVNTCADLRLPEFVKHARKARGLREGYLKNLAIDLQYEVIDDFAVQCERIMEQCEHDFLIMWFTVNGEIKKRYRGLDHDEMRTDAYLCRLMCEAVNRFGKRLDEEITKRTGMEGHTQYPFTDRLSELMVDYSGGIELDGSELIDRCVRILDKNIKTITIKID